ncbi:MAG TPA: ABC transporter substrate-binding protein [Bacillota bacterium]|nr:ABC transporter substrate-binding protein [Bacillota bacterium]
MRKWLSFTIVAVIGSIVLVACGSDDANGDGDTFQIGATQIVEHPSLDAAYDGFKDALDDQGLDVEYDFQSAQNDVSNAGTIGKNFVSDDVDLIFANSTPSAMGAKQATSDIPIVFTSVTDAEIAGLVESNDEPGENVTGVVDLHPDQITRTIEFIDDNFPDSTIGMVYNAGEENSVVQVEYVKEALEGTTLDMTDRSISTSAEVQQAASSLVGEADVFYIITDNTAVSALESIIGVANDNDMPLFVGEPDSVEKGGFMAFGFDYYDLGYRSGEMAAEILTDDKEAGELSVEFPPNVEVYMNKEAAEAQGIDWNDEWEEDANLVETEEE